MPSTVRERKEKQAMEPLEDQYECTAEPASHVKNPGLAPAFLHAAYSLSRLSPATLTDKPLGASRRGTDVVHVEAHVFLHEVYQQVSGLACQQTQGRHGTQKLQDTQL